MLFRILVGSFLALVVCCVLLINHNFTRIEEEAEALSDELDPGEITRSPYGDIIIQRRENGILELILIPASDKRLNDI